MLKKENCRLNRKQKTKENVKNSRKKVKKKKNVIVDKSFISSAHSHLNAAKSFGR